MSLLRDLTYTLRAMRKQPFLAAIAVLTLALGIGANTAIFSVVHAVLLAPFAYPVEEPHEVLFLSESSPSWDEMSVSYMNYEDWKRESQTLETIAGFRNTSYNLTGTEEPIRLAMTQVAEGYFDIMGVTAQAGRLLEADDHRVGTSATVVLNHPLWEARFGGSADILGTTVHLDERPYDVVGVLPPDFDLDATERAYVALEPWAHANDGTKLRGNHQGMRVLARMRDGVAFDEAAAEMKTIAARLEEQYPDTNSGIGVIVERLDDRRVEGYRATLWLLLAAVSVVLVVACANVANLLLARSIGRRRDVAVRTALGASRGRLVQQGLTEGIVLALAGGLLGVVLAFWSLSLLRGLLPEDVPRLQNVSLDWQVLVYTFALALVTGVVFGAFPSLFGTGSGPASAMRDGGRSASSHSGAGRTLLVAEMALATLLLIGAMLLIRTIGELTRVDPGFRADNVLTLEVGLPYTRYDGAARLDFIQQIRDELETLPGVRSATAGLVLPMLGSHWGSVFIVSDKPVPPRAEIPSSIFTPVAPGYFETLQIPLLAGRTLNDTDDADAVKVVVVNETFAERMWPGENPVGKRLKQGWPEDEGEWNPWREVVGVVGSVKQFGLDADTSMQVFMPVAQGPPIWAVQVALKTETNPLSLAEPAKAALHRLDAEIPVFDIRTMDSILADSIAPRRFTMVLLGVFAALALVLAAIGLYGVVAYSVAARTREIGLRMSVGAGRGSIFALVLRSGMLLAAIGAAIGILGALVASRLLESLLFGVATHDVVSFAVVPAILLLVALAACAVPALAATRVDPIRALRYE